MSHEVYEGTVYITRYVGSASQGDDRAQWQFTFPNRRDYASVARDEAEAILRALAASLGFAVVETTS